MTEGQLRAVPKDTEEMWVRSRIEVSVPSYELSGKSRLRKLLLGQESLKHLRSFVVKDLDCLESLYANDFVCSGEDQYRKERLNDGLLSVQHCPKLQVIDLGDYTCAEFRQFSVSDLPSLECLHLGTDCFAYGREFVLAGNAVAGVQRRSAEAPPRDGEGVVVPVRPTRRFPK